MTHTQILSEIQDVMRRVFDKADLNIVDATMAKDVPEWDSLAHIELIVAIEKHFRLKFTLKEVQSFHNVGEMCDAIAQKVS